MNKCMVIRRIVLVFVAAAAAVCSVSARQPRQGYRGFVDISYMMFAERYDDFTRYSSHFNVSTVHGYQIIPEMFVGAGLEVGSNVTADTHYIPVFADIRTDLKFGRLTPFADLRVGYVLSNDSGMMLQPTVGYRFDFGRKVGVNLGVGYALQQARLDVVDNYYVDDGGYMHYDTVKLSKWFNALVLRIGFDF